ncbi:MAG: type III-A CRISPR-associated protein Csm2 [Anaeromicrobium sp.]|jgi:CRISPR-associated protein Csm2|uniref:type III-A CRISPR-associated protein Csm2 n=1 Tax=Anaeromicrobium sp. TaxID=1929132 RepID=UPI0025D0F52C|nr:type III-A CRISPR-associated protein Csm2 [Anaeromicrobium sp.]MCT4593245.1 type III-A CRISPR-associated protein Csm2 [Anaeromicrobium sp.]
MGKSDNKHIRSNFPVGYLANGYFNENGNLRKELIDEIAEKVAKSFGKRMTVNQLRKFYGYVKTMERVYCVSGLELDEERFVLEIAKLKAAVHYASSKKNSNQSVTKEFYKFVCMNINNIQNKKDIIEGFIPHFQAVVAYFTYYL